MVDVINIANIVVTSFYDESFREKKMCKQHRARAKEGGWGRNERREVRKGSAMEPPFLHLHGHPAAHSGDGDGEAGQRWEKVGCGGGVGFLPCCQSRQCAGRES